MKKNQSFGDNFGDPLPLGPPQGQIFTYAVKHINFTQTNVTSYKMDHNEYGDSVNLSLTFVVLRLMIFLTIGRISMTFSTNFNFHLNYTNISEPFTFPLVPI